MKLDKKKLTKQRLRPEDIYKHIQALKQGIGYVQPKKGKGSYTRKSRYKWKIYTLSDTTEMRFG